ncbi:MAG: hypothetical protein MI892_11070 [Desulfobacterales bacterium]|nr:hypothetical protein [Desulfobacterales bacterium]
MLEIISSYQTSLIWISGLSVLFFLASLAAVPWLVARIPQTYFIDLASKGHTLNQKTSFVLWWAKTIVGTILVIAGVIMLFIPGQGVLTILAGLIFLEFPGKKQMVLRMAKNQSVRKSLNWLRKKRGVPPLEFPPQ